MATLTRFEAKNNNLLNRDTNDITEIDNSDNNFDNDLESTKSDDSNTGCRITGPYQVGYVDEESNLDVEKYYGKLGTDIIGTDEKNGGPNYSKSKSESDEIVTQTNGPPPISILESSQQDQSDSKLSNLHTLPSNTSYSNISKIIFLGTASGAPVPGKRNVSSLVITMSNGLTYMVDCGEGTQHQVKFTGGGGSSGHTTVVNTKNINSSESNSNTVTNVRLSKLDTIFITHLHGDHCYGLFGLILSSGMEQVRATCLTVVGPEGIKDLVINVFKLTGQNKSVGWNGDFGLQFVELSDLAWRRRKNIVLGRDWSNDNSVAKVTKVNCKIDVNGEKTVTETIVTNTSTGSTPNQTTPRPSIIISQQSPIQPLHVIATPLIHTKSMLSWGYCFQEFDKPGAVDVKKVTSELFLRPGPLVGKLKNGETVSYEVEENRENGEIRMVQQVEEKSKKNLNQLQGKKNKNINSKVNQESKGNQNQNKPKDSEPSPKRQKTPPEEEQIQAPPQAPLWRRVTKTVTPTEFLSKCQSPPTPGKKICVLQDSCNSVYALNVCQNADLFIHESTFERAQRTMAIQKGHSTSEMAAQYGNLANAKQLVLTHFSGKYCESNSKEKDLIDMYFRNVGKKVDEVGGINYEAKWSKVTPRGNSNGVTNRNINGVGSTESNDQNSTKKENDSKINTLSNEQDSKAVISSSAATTLNGTANSNMTNGNSKSSNSIKPKLNSLFKHNRSFHSDLLTIDLLCPPLQPKTGDDLKDLIKTMIYHAKTKNLSNILDATTCGEDCLDSDLSDSWNSLNNMYTDSLSVDTQWPDLAEVILGTEAREVFKGHSNTTTASALNFDKVIVARDFLVLENNVKVGGFVVASKLARKPLVSKPLIHEDQLEMYREMKKKKREDKLKDKNLKGNTLNVNSDTSDVKNGLKQ